MSGKTFTFVTRWESTGGKQSMHSLGWMLSAILLKRRTAELLRLMDATPVTSRLISNDPLKSSAKLLLAPLLASHSALPQGVTVTLCAVRRVRSRPLYWSDARSICGWWVPPHSQLRLNSIYPLKLPAICSLPLCWASHATLPPLAADYCERLTE